MFPLSQGILSDIRGLGGRRRDPGGRRLDDQVAESLVGDRLSSTNVGVRGDSFREGAWRAVVRRAASSSVRPGRGQLSTAGRRSRGRQGTLHPHQARDVDPTEDSSVVSRPLRG